ncbi:hypothetical protein SDJN02_21765 [Cucurbita argyrosperma subsp. argyrosperma]|nr:hypothetical protein SDJN02_21765 [Cucurbita argyrosperma subsp. argyrosperma]
MLRGRELLYSLDWLGNSAMKSKISQVSCVRTAHLNVSDHPTKIRGFFFELDILLKKLLLEFCQLIQLLHKTMILSTKMNHQGPKFIKMLLFPHP